jgi:hypothetical protein
MTQIGCQHAVHLLCQTCQQYMYCPTRCAFCSCETTACCLPPVHGVIPTYQLMLHGPCMPSKLCDMYLSASHQQFIHPAHVLRWLLGAASWQMTWAWARRCPL